MKNTCLLFLGVLLAQCGLAAHAVTLTVASTNDDGSTSPMTLRGAIYTADGDADPDDFPYTILVPPGTYNLTNGALPIGSLPPGSEFYGYGSNVLILGTGTAANTIVAQTDGDTRVFILDPGGYGNETFAFANLTIKGGNDTYPDPFGLQDAGGSGISVLNETDYYEENDYYEDQLSITNCVFEDNTASGGGNGFYDIQGGAAIAAFGTQLTLVGCVFSNNTLKSSTTNSFIGGAVLLFAYDEGYTLTAINCAFLNNRITGNAHQSASGGALAVICPYGYTSAFLTNCTFIGNSITSTAPGEPYDGGGAVYLGFESTNVLIGCTFSNNQANGNVNLGGAIFSEDDSTNYIRYCAFLDDSVAAGGQGAEIYLDGPPGPFKANNNWWGSNSGPASNAVVGATNSVAKAPTTWLFLTNTANPAAVAVGYATTLTASFLTNSAGVTIDATNLSALTNVPVSFSAIDGSISSAQNVIQASGTAKAIFTGTIAGSGRGSASVDGETSSAAILVTASAGPSTVQVGHVSQTNALIEVTGVPELTYRVLASENLFSWSQIGAVQMPAGGSSNFFDTNAPLYPHRFYEVVYP